MVKSYVVKERNNRLIYSDAAILDSPESLSIVSHPTRLKLLMVLSKETMYPAELAKKLSMHEQKVYYHIKQLQNAGMIEIVEKKEIRGTIAKKFRTKSLNFAVCLSKEWSNIEKLVTKRDNPLEKFLDPFVKDGSINCSIIVGSPDPHGPYKARTRDGHYAIDLALLFGQCGDINNKFTTKLDVDVSLKDSEHMVIVGGPVTNLVSSKINEFLPVHFSDSKPWGLESPTEKYTEESIGVICRIPNPFDKEKYILFLAGISSIGTKAAVIAFTQYTDEIISNYEPGIEWFRVVQGYDLDGDGRIDSIEIIE